MREAPDFASFDRRDGTVIKVLSRVPDPVTLKFRVEVTGAGGTVGYENWDLDRIRYYADHGAQLIEPEEAA